MRFFRLCIVIVVWLSLAVSAYCHAQEPQEPERPMTRKERREERKRLKNTPLQLPELSRDGFSVSGGQRLKRDTTALHIADSLAVGQDSLAMDSLAMRRDSLATGSFAAERDSLSSTVRRDSLTSGDWDESALLGEGEKYSQSLRDSTLHVADSVGGMETMHMLGTVDSPDSTTMASMSARERRRLRKEQMRADTTLYRHSPLFKDTIAVSPMAWISLVAPGFGQFYNGDYWKIPVLYATVGTSLYFGIKQHKQYVKYRNEYNYYLVRDPNREKYVAQMDAAQTRMIQHNTWRQVLFAGAIGSYLYFIGDGVINYPTKDLRIKTATTLSTIFPGAGQFYNGSYWRAPIFIGGIASMIYVIDWNDRIYQRYKTAYTAVTDDDPITTPPRGMPSDPNSLKNTRDSARRNRDLCIILTGLVYFINIMDAHVDAHLKDYDISDDLSYRLRLEPSLNTINTQTHGSTNAFGFNLSYTF